MYFSSQLPTCQLALVLGQTELSQLTSHVFLM